MRRPWKCCSLQVGPSLGSFSVSAAMLQALSEEFAKELAEKTEKLDTDPHFWMPLTLSAKDYKRALTRTCRWHTMLVLQL